jgi:chromosome segregation ATPase
MLLVLIALGALAVCTYFLVRAFRRGKAENARLWGELSSATAARNDAEKVAADKEEEMSELSSRLSLTNREINEARNQVVEAEARAYRFSAELAAATLHLNEAQANVRDLNAKFVEQEAAGREDSASIDEAWGRLEIAEKELAELQTRFNKFIKGTRLLKRKKPGVAAHA